MIEFTRQNIDKLLDTIWKWTIAIGPGEMFNDRDYGFYIIDRMTNPSQGNKGGYFWHDRFTHSMGAYMKKTYFDTEKEAIEYFLELQERGMNLHVYQINNPIGLGELIGKWKTIMENR